MSYKYIYPSIEYVLATGHYPEPCRKDVRHHPTFFPTPPVQVFHVAHGHIPVFIPLPPSYGYSKRYSDPAHAAAVYRPRNRCFTVTVPNTAANKKSLPSRNHTQTYRLEPASPTMGMSVMTSIKDRLPTSSGNVLHVASDEDVETSDRDVDAASGASDVSPSAVSNKTMSESSANLVESDVETMFTPANLGGVKNGQPSVRGQFRTKPQLSEDQDIYRKMPAKPRTTWASSHSRSSSSSSASSSGTAVVMGSSGLPSRKRAPTSVRRGIRVNCQ